MRSEPGQSDSGPLSLLSRFPNLLVRRCSMQDTSGYPEDVSSRWISGCTRVAAGGPCTLVAASGVEPFLCFPGLSRGLYRSPECSCLGFLSLVVQQGPCRSTNGSASVAGLAPCATYRPS